MSARSSRAYRYEPALRCGILEALATDSVPQDDAAVLRAFLDRTHITRDEMDFVLRVFRAMRDADTRAADHRKLVGAVLQDASDGDLTDAERGDLLWAIAEHPLSRHTAAQALRVVVAFNKRRGRPTLTCVGGAA